MTVEYSSGEELPEGHLQLLCSEFCLYLDFHYSFLLLVFLHEMSNSAHQSQISPFFSAQTGFLFT